MSATCEQCVNATTANLRNAGDFPALLCWRTPHRLVCTKGHILISKDALTCADFQNVSSEGGK